MLKLTMETTEIRHKNLLKLIAMYETQSDLALAIGCTPGYINQLKLKDRPISEKTARKIEKKLNLPANFFEKQEDKTVTEPNNIAETPKIYTNEAFLLLEHEWNALTPITRAFIEDFIKKLRKKSIKKNDVKFLHSVLDKIAKD